MAWGTQDRNRRAFRDGLNQFRSNDHNQFRIFTGGVFRLEELPENRDVSDERYFRKRVGHRFVEQATDGETLAFTPVRLRYLPSARSEPERCNH